MEMRPTKSYKTCVRRCGKKRERNSLLCRGCKGKHINLRPHYTNKELRRAKQFRNRPKHAMATAELKQWEKVRRQILPPGVTVLCCRCVRDKRVTSATVADHILPKALYPELRFEVSNLQPLCGPCHNKKSAMQGEGKAYDYLNGRIYDIPTYRDEPIVVKRKRVTRSTRIDRDFPEEENEESGGIAA